MTNEEKAILLRQLAEYCRSIYDKLDDSVLDEIQLLWSLKNDMNNWETSLMIEREELLGLHDNDENPYDYL